MHGVSKNIEYIFSELKIICDYLKSQRILLTTEDSSCNVHPTTPIVGNMAGVDTQRERGKLPTHPSSLYHTNHSLIDDEDQSGFLDTLIKLALIVLVSLLVYLATNKLISGVLHPGTSVLYLADNFF